MALIKMFTFLQIWGLDGLFIILETKRENKQMFDSKG